MCLMLDRREIKEKFQQHNFLKLCQLMVRPSECRCSLTIEFDYLWSRECIPVSLSWVKRSLRVPVDSASENRLNRSNLGVWTYNSS